MHLLRKRNEGGEVPFVEGHLHGRVLLKVRNDHDPKAMNDPKVINPLKTILRKEVIQPQVPLRLPCYDFTPVADPTVVGCLLLLG